MQIITQARLLHITRYCGQKIFPPRIGIIGGYHCGNIGDLALGITTAAMSGMNSSSLQTIYTLSRWPDTPYGIVGGGAVITSYTIEHLYNRFHRKPEKLAIVGVDIDFGLISEYRSFIDDISFFSTRSRRNAQVLIDKYNSRNVKSHLDICFLLPRVLDGAHREDNYFSFNLCPRFHKPPKYASKTEDPSLIETRKKNYEIYVNAVISKALQKYKHLVHVPFTAADDIVAQKILGHLPIKFMPYRPSVRRVIDLVSRSDMFFASRYHSLVFCLAYGVPVIPFLYADKCYNLVSDLGSITISL